LSFKGFRVPAKGGNTPAKLPWIVGQGLCVLLTFVFQGEGTPKQQLLLNVFFELVTECTKFIPHRRLTDCHVVTCRFQTGKLVANFLKQIAKKIV